MTHTGYVRRTDLQFRGEFPDILTTIYQLSGSEYIIYCDTDRDDFEEFNRVFEYSLRPMGTPVKLSLDKPVHYLEIIPKITDTDISKKFEGVCMTAPLLFNLLLSKFPTIRFHKVETAPGGGKILIYTARLVEASENTTTYKFLSTGDRLKLTEFLKGLHLPVSFEIIDENVTELTDDFPQYEYEPIQMLHAARLRKERAYDFSQRDEALWYDNIDKIFEGNFKKNDLYFLDETSYSCYVDFSSFSNIDLRNHLLLFQTVFLTLPFETNIEKWLNKAQISKNEFLDLIARGRVKLVLTQMEVRYDIGFILEAFAANANGVITRRALATLQQADIISIADNYLLNDDKLLKELVPVCMDLAKKSGLDSKFMYEMLVWPLKARRKSFEPLQIKGVFSTSVFGINNAIEKKVSETTGRDLSFEFTTNASSIHLASSLDATYFPFYSEGGYSDQFYAQIMGDLLNLYKCANTSDLREYMDGRTSLNSGVIPINPIDIIDANNFITLSELEREIKKYPSFSGGKFLMETLAQATVEERAAKIKYYNDEVIKNINNPKISPDILDLGTNLALDTAGFASGFPLMGSAVSILKMGGKAIKNASASQKFSEQLDVALSDDVDKANIHFLTKINRVARIKRSF